MTKSLPRFSTALVWWLVAVVACGVGWKLLDDRRRSRDGDTPNPILQLARPFLGGEPQDEQRFTSTVVDEPAVPELLPDESRATIEAADLVERAARNLLQYRSLAARIRHRIDLYDQPLTGSGVYQQWGRGQEPRRLRLELKLHVAGQTASLQQIGDGRFLWDRRDILGKVSLSRVDLRKIRQAQDQLGADASGAGFDGWLALGGLPQLLTGINESFQFTTAEPAQLGKLPTWVVVGTWRDEALVRLFPSKNGAPAGRASMPTQAPQRVLVVLGADQNIPLFPYRIEYQRIKAGGGAGEGPQFEPMAKLQLFEVQPGAELDPEAFRYDPGNQEVVDETQALLRRLRGETPTGRDAAPVN